MMIDHKKMIMYASIVGKKKYLKENRQPASGGTQKKQRLHHGHE